MTTPASTVEPRKRRFHRPSLAQAGSLVALIGGVITIVLIFKPDWRPLQSADVGKLTIDKSSIRARPAPLRRFYSRIQLRPQGETAAFLAQRGMLIEFSFEANGFRGKTLPIRRELIDAETNDVVPERGTNPAYSDQSIGITPETNNDARKWFVWSPVPKTRKSYYVTVSIYQPRKGDVEVPLQDFDTPTFRGLSAK
jgi:hypothetical protein